ncbi:MAG TPA: glycoside hydrolase family 2 TIM barrel-domain containing protein [Mycobacteriales bacterium]|nr:glycoside hydrolase family 2 TIM barrel-domain containing protein [Mycobacteriales bacterium]
MAPVAKRISRRTVLRAGLTGAGVAAVDVIAGQAIWGGSGVQAQENAQATTSELLTTGWLFGGEYTAGSEAVDADDSGFVHVTVPHCVAPLDWHGWDPADWQRQWIYRRHFPRPELSGGERLFVDFAGSMTATTVSLNGQPLGEHRGGYLPFSFEITDLLRDGDNVLAVVVDGRWADIPPDGSAVGAKSVDYLQPAGIYREVSLRTVPAVFVSDVFAKPVDVLSDSRRVEVEVSIDGTPGGAASVQVDLSRHGRPVAITTAPVNGSSATATLRDLGEIELWDVDSPNLYDVTVTLLAAGPVHRTSTRIGFREARFENDGFFLNGRRLKIFGLNRHQIYPYAGMAMPARVQRKDAEILKNEFNCNMVRCSHYPHSSHFLDACDELGMLVWEEPPGWQYVSDDPAWRDLADRDVHDMVIRDRNRPSVVLWAARLNETKNYPDFYARTTATIHALDDSRPTTGSMIYYDTKDWDQDVFAFDDYLSEDGNALLRPPLPDVPYFVSESVGALSGPPLYRWLDDAHTLARQAICHAQVHNQAGSDDRFGGLLGWCAFDYDSLTGNIYQNMKTPGIADTFRVPKPGAAFYRSQVDPSTRVVIEPAFFWDFGPNSPAEGPGAGSVIGSNCDRLEIYVDGRHHLTATPDIASFPYLHHPLYQVDLNVTGTELRIEGYVGDERVLTRRMSADTDKDRLLLAADDERIDADGADATRVVVRAVDAFGNQRPYVGGAVEFTLSGPGQLIGPDSFDWADTPGVAAVWIRSEAGRTGTVRLTAKHAVLGEASCDVDIR